MNDLPVTGEARDELVELDDWMRSWLGENKVPGSAVAIARDGHVVYARGFGYADRQEKIAVQPDSLFRIASVSKPLTAVAVMKLVQEEKLKLEDKVFDFLSLEPHFDAAGQEDAGKFDERWKQIAIVQCLAHTGGWDRGQSYDPMFQAARMARSMKIELPVLPEHVIRYQLGQPLDFDPLTRYAYSNFGYCVLGRVIEKVTGQAYEKYVQDAILRPLGIERARIGGSLEDQRAEGEVKYYDVHDGKGLATVGPGAGKDEVPISYGTWRQETLDAHGGWIASAVDLVKFAAAFDLIDGGRKTRSGLLSPANVRLMFSPQVTITRPGDGESKGVYYGLGWQLRSEDDVLVPRHGGALPCTAATLMHFPNGTNLAMLTNLGQKPDGAFLGRSLEEPLTRLVRETKTWPG